MTIITLFPYSCYFIKILSLLYIQVMNLSIIFHRQNSTLLFIIMHLFSKPTTSSGIFLFVICCYLCSTYCVSLCNTISGPYCFTNYNPKPPRINYFYYIIEKSYCFFYYINIVQKIYFINFRTRTNLLKFSIL